MPDRDGSTPDDGLADDELLSVTSRAYGPAVIVTAVGEVDMTTAPQLDTTVRAALAQPGQGPVVVDLTAVSFFASAGLGVLVGAHAAATVRREPLRVVVDHNRPVVRPLHIVGLDEVLALYDTVTDALSDRPRHPEA